MSGRWAKDQEARTARIIARDNGICWICKKPGATTADHVIPRSKGGGNEDRNLKAAHRLCNSLRGNKFAMPRARVSRWANQ